MNKYTVVIEFNEDRGLDRDFETYHVVAEGPIHAALLARIEGLKTLIDPTLDEETLINMRVCAIFEGHQKNIKG